MLAIRRNKLELPLMTMAAQYPSAIRFSVSCLSFCRHASLPKLARLKQSPQHRCVLVPCMVSKILHINSVNLICLKRYRSDHTKSPPKTHLYCTLSYILGSLSLIAYTRNKHHHQRTALNAQRMLYNVQYTTYNTNYTKYAHTVQRKEGRRLSSLLIR